MPNYRWLENIAVTGAEIFGGYVLAVVVGVGIALLFSWFRWLELAIMPLLVSLNMIPKVALGPLIIVWFKYGIGPNIMMAFAICFFPIVLTTARGLREVEPDLLDLVRTLKGSRWQVFTKIQLPGALPYIFSGMKVAAILAVAGAIVGEFLGSDRGLGYLMLQVQVTLDTAGDVHGGDPDHAARRPALSDGARARTPARRAGRAARMSVDGRAVHPSRRRQEGLPHARQASSSPSRRRPSTSRPASWSRWSAPRAAARPRC